MPARRIPVSFGTTCVNADTRNYILASSMIRKIDTITRTFASPTSELQDDVSYDRMYDLFKTCIEYSSTSKFIAPNDLNARDRLIHRYENILDINTEVHRMIDRILSAPISDTEKIFLIECSHSLILIHRDPYYNIDMINKFIDFIRDYVLSSLKPIRDLCIALTSMVRSEGKSFNFMDTPVDSQLSNELAKSIDEAVRNIQYRSALYSHMALLFMNALELDDNPVCDVKPKLNAYLEFHKMIVHHGNLDTERFLSSEFRVCFDCMNIFPIDITDNIFDMIDKYLCFDTPRICGSSTGILYARKSTLEHYSYTDLEQTINPLDHH